MGGQTLVVSVALLLALCCALIPTGGQSAGGLLALQQPARGRQEGAPLGDYTRDDTEEEQGLTADLDTPGKVKRDAEEDTVAGECRV